jgi:aspartate aminotransferase-like enzyme
LFTPGPLLTSQTVKEAMLRDLGSRDSEFIETIKIFREGLLKVAGKITHHLSMPIGFNLFITSNYQQLKESL